MVLPAPQPLLELEYSMARSFQNGILIALDSVGIDPLGHTRPESVYAESAFLFPPAATGPVASLPNAPVAGVLYETEVTDGCTHGAIECALTYTTLFSGINAIREHGLMQGLGLKNALLESLIRQQNLFSLIPDSCLANAVFPVHLPCFGSSYLQDILPSFSKHELETSVRFRHQALKLTSPARHGMAELYTLAEINQNIFVYAAQQAGIQLRTWREVQQGKALSSSLTHELEAEFDFSALGLPPLPRQTPEQAGEVLVSLASQHQFTFYKYQIPDLVSHTGQIEEARAVFATIERFLKAVLDRIHPEQTCVVITSDHGHLEQIAFTRGHPKSKVPTWCFAPDAIHHQLVSPTAIFDFFANRFGVITSSYALT